MNGPGCTGAGKASQLNKKEVSMVKENNKNSYKRFVLFTVGIFILALGITLILVWFSEAVMLFKGAVGVILALAGLFMVYAVSKTG
jgi:uncharacterized membrane protein